jgi:ABC-type multidrug transport system fused ATPase/permease subunit
MKDQNAPNSKRRIYFWRASRFLWPYRKLVGTSVVAAVFVGLFLTSGLGAVLPIFQILINGDTIPNWVGRQTASQRLGLLVADDPKSLRVVQVKPDLPAAAAGIKPGDELAIEPHPSDDTDLIQALSNPDRSDLGLLAINARGTRAMTVTGMSPIPIHLRVAQIAAARLPRDPVWAIAAVFGLVMGLGMVGNVFRFFQEYLSDKSAIRAVEDIRRHAYDHVLHIPISFFTSRGTADVTSRLTQDCQILQDGMKTVLGQFVQEPIKAAFSFGLALTLDWRLTIFIVVFAPVMVVTMRKFGKKMRRASRAAMQRSSVMLEQVEASLQGIRVVKASAGERFERRRYASIMRLFRFEQLKMARYEAYATPVVETIAMLVVIAVVLLAAYFVLIQHTLSPSRFFLLMFCLASIGESLRRVSKLNAVMARSDAAAGRIFEMLDEQIERRRIVNRGRIAAAQLPPKIVLPAMRRQIAFENVSFTYDGSSIPAVADVSLDVPRGQVVAVVGRNGSGKTTLLGLVPRFYDPQIGRVTIDGIDLRAVTLKSLRRQLAIVTQEAVVFPGTVHENIAYGLPAATRQDVEAAAKRAFCHDFIMEKSQGYDSLLGGLGSQLSGGQRQRLNIARAILRDAPILILDEATSQVDAESEHLIQKAIDSVMHERTTFVIAHRFSTIMRADLIVVMDAGRIVGKGTHDDLLRTCPTYKQLYERQLFAA